MTKRGYVLSLLCLLFLVATLYGDDVKEKESPWLFTPLLSSGPKLGTSLGAMGGYLYKFDKESPSSTFSLMGTYSNNDSYVSGAFAKMFFDHNKQRMIMGTIYGKINNEYHDFLGTGLNVKTTDNIHALFTRYSHLVYQDLYLGAQFVATNYAISGNDIPSEEILNFIGLKGYNSNGVGITFEYDTRDNINSPAKGSFVNVNNISFRKALGGHENFDVIYMKARHYIEHTERFVTALRFDSEWTIDAPQSAYATTNLRGYTQGQYLAQNSSVLEAEERIDLAWGIGATVFMGTNCLYDSFSDCSYLSNYYSVVGGGLNYMIKKEEKMVVRLEGAKGKGDNYGIYMQFGRAF